MNCPSVRYFLVVWMTILTLHNYDYGRYLPSSNGRAASSNHDNAALKSLVVGSAAGSRSCSTSSTAQRKTNIWSRNVSRSVRVITSSSSLRANSVARCRATQSHCRHACEQYFFGLPDPAPWTIGLRHHLHLCSEPPGFDLVAGTEAALLCSWFFVMTKRYAKLQQNSWIQAHTCSHDKIGRLVGSRCSRSFVLE